MTALIRRPIPDTSYVERIAAFCAGEVKRQGHLVFDPNDGGLRLAWMLYAWEFAALRFAAGEQRPSIETIQSLGRLVERSNEFGFRRCNVRVGDHIAPPYEQVRAQMTNLWGTIGNVMPRQGRWGIAGGMTADDFYVEFQRIHPFRDGNGRVGKILHNWILGTLDAPVLIEDYFGWGNP